MKNFLRSMIRKLVRLFKRKSVVPKAPKYSMTSVDDEAVMRIRVDEGPYTGVIYSYGDVSFEEPENNSAGPLKLRFNYDIIQYPTNVSTDGFSRVAFEILYELLTDTRRHGLEQNRGTNPNFITEN